MAVEQSRRLHFQPINSVLVPIIHGDDRTDALDAALALGQQVTVMGLVRVAGEELLSGAAAAAREMRERLQALAEKHGLAVHAHVAVAVAPWNDLLAVARELRPDLLLLDWDTHLELLDVSAREVLSAPPCNVALMRGAFPPRVERVLMPIRGGPHAELVVRVGLCFDEAQHTALHLRAPLAELESEAPFRGLERVLPQLRGVVTRVVTTEDPGATILAESEAYDLLIMGATVLPPDSATPLGALTDRVLNETHTPILVVKKYSARLEPVAGELAGGAAISILVDKWFAEKTFHADEFGDLDRLLRRKQEQGITISLALPALNEEATVGNVIRTMQRALMEEAPLIDEIVLMDSQSSDRTREIAADLGVTVHIHQELLPRFGPRRGKGEALWKSLLVTRGDLIAWIDTDIVNIHPRFVYGILGPLIMNPSVQFVKGFYQRPLNVGGELQAGGGRVTELMARPLLNLFYPELSGVIQPLSGEYAGRRAALEQARFYSGYGVETGLLIDIFEQYGLDAIAQVDLLERVHHNQPLEALSKMSFAILQVVIQRQEERMGKSLLADVNKTMKMIRFGRGGYSLEVEEIAERSRPAMATIAEYLQRFPERTRAGVY